MYSYIVASSSPSVLLGTWATTTTTVADNFPVLPSYKKGAFVHSECYSFYPVSNQSAKKGRDEVSFRGDEYDTSTIIIVGKCKAWWYTVWYCTTLL